MNKPVITKISDRDYILMSRLKERFGYKSTYEMTFALISIVLKYMDDYPFFHDGAEPATIQDLDDMFSVHIRDKACNGSANSLEELENAPKATYKMHPLQRDDFLSDYMAKKD